MKRCRRCEHSADLCLSCASAYLGVSKASMTRMIKARNIPFFSYPFGGKRLAVADLDAFKGRCKKSPRVSEQILDARLGPDDISFARRLALKKLGRAS